MQTVGSPLDETDLVVQSLDEPERDPVARIAGGGDGGPLPVDHLGELLVGLEALPFQLRPPVLEELARRALEVVRISEQGVLLVLDERAAPGNLSERPEPPLPAIMANFRPVARAPRSGEYRALRVMEPRLLPTRNHEDPHCVFPALF